MGNGEGSLFVERFTEEYTTNAIVGHDTMALHIGLHWMLACARARRLLTECLQDEPAECNKTQTGAHCWII